MPVGTESPRTGQRSGCRSATGRSSPRSNQLSRAGRTVKLEPKAMSVLVYLADRPGQVVSREALLSAVWPGVVVGDDSLTQVVIKLRKALGEVPEKPAYIQTISKGGYRLVAPVVRSEEIASASVPQNSKALSVAPARRVPMDSGRWALPYCSSRPLASGGSRTNAQPAARRAMYRWSASKRHARRSRPSPSSRSRRSATTRSRCCWRKALPRTS